MSERRTYRIAGAALLGLAGAGVLAAAAVIIGGTAWAQGQNVSETWFEHVQHLTLLAAAALCAVKSARGRYWLWLLGSAFFLLLLGEELNWGQELLHFATPQSVAAINAHQELSIHNMNALIDYSKKIGLVLFTGFFAVTGLVIAAAARARLTPFIYCLALYAAAILTLAGGRLAGYDAAMLFVPDEASESMTYLAVLGALALLPRDFFGMGWRLFRRIPPEGPAGLSPA